MAEPRLTIANHSVSVSDAWVLLQLPSDLEFVGFDYAGSLRNGPPSPTDVVELQDFGRLLLLGVSLTADDVRSCLMAAEQAPWAAVPKDARLADTPYGGAGTPYAHAIALYRHFRYRHRLRVTVASAILHLKRPSLVPLLNNRTLAFYSEQAVDLAATSGSDSPLYWEVFRRDLIASAEGVDALRRQFAEADDVVSHALSRLSDVRLFGIAVNSLAAN
ncbi:hypothetical protein C5N14_21605 [Micromonospora sp. MW-13]|uniref:DUF6308 family protein n=1 Tax=Micromonospora sp. MW-13 TaxID=2094022 RepID=UPI000EC6CF69|nr:DUF6308 family protein [Micromonospora sp. MW-13]RGC66806.1 hypothetical protein C5N14_21605 [Micromonospora sp. MW-13]